MDFKNKPPPIKTCPMCRLAMVGDRTDSCVAGFNVYHCLGCDLTISSTPPASRDEDE
jgi:hypothetical protein